VHCYNIAMRRSGNWSPPISAGVMICDRGRSYDAAGLAGVALQKCLAHLIRNSAKLSDEKAGPATHFGRTLRSWVFWRIVIWTKAGLASEITVHGESCGVQKCAIFCGPSSALVQSTASRYWVNRFEGKGGIRYTHAG
jgi:hypothetical protein